MITEFLFTAFLSVIFFIHGLRMISRTWDSDDENIPLWLYITALWGLVLVLSVGGITEICRGV